MLMVAELQYECGIYHQSTFVYTIQRNEGDTSLAGPMFGAPIALATTTLKGVLRSILKKPLTAKWLLVILDPCLYTYRRHKVSLTTE